MLHSHQGRPPGRATIWAARIIVLMVVSGAALLVLRYHDEFEHWAVLGYPAVFLICLVTNAGILLPMPGFGITVFAGSVFNPWIVGLVAGLGQIIGDLNSYLAGSSSQTIVDDLPFHERLSGWMAKRGVLTIFLLAALPNPILSAAIIIAGATRMPFRVFVVTCLAGKVLKSTVAALIGHYGVGLARTWMGL